MEAAPRRLRPAARALGRSSALLLALSLAAAAAAGRQDEPAPDPRPASEILAEILQKRDLVDFQVFETLGRRRNRRGLEALERCVTVLFSREGIDALYHAFRHYRGAGELEEQAVAFLVGETRAELTRRRRAATGALVEFGGAAVDELLEVARKHSDGACRSIAVGGLVPVFHAQRTPEALELLIAWYRVPRSGTRETALRTLVVFDDPASMEIFADALRDRRLGAPMKSMILEALAEIGGPPAAEIAVDALRSKEPAVQLGAIRTLTALGHDGHLRRLERLERAKDPAVRHAAFLAQDPLRAADPEWEQELLRAARSRDFALRMAVATCLGRRGGEEGFSALLGLLEDPNHLVRRDAVRALVELRRQESLAPLVERMQVDTARLRDEIRAALEQLTGLDHGANPERWAKWWSEERDAYQLPPLDEAQALVEAREERRAEQRTQTMFYGIPIESDRVAFVLDVSGSMAQLGYTGEMRIDAVKLELLRAIDELPVGGRFNLLFFDTSVYRWKRKLQPVSDKNRQSAKKYASKQGPGGGTALYDALIEAYEDAEIDTIVLLSDGQPSEGKVIEPEEILERVLHLNEIRDVVIHTVSVDFTSDLMRDLATQTGGTYKEVR